MKVIYGLFLSTVLGFGLGWLICKAIRFLCRDANRQQTNARFAKMQILAAAFVAFMHGAQDGQKFIGVLLLGIALNQGSLSVMHYTIPIWLMLLCSVVMALGTSIGGARIIKSVGMDMVRMENYEGFAADLAGAFSLLAASVWGLPVSTTHTKTTAIMGVGAVKRLSNVNWNVVREMSLAWILTLPGCGLIGYLMARLFFWIF